MYVFNIEYFDMGKVIMKGDVYSFGVFFLEFLIGRRLIDDEFFEEGIKFVMWVRSYFFVFIVLKGKLLF